MKTPPRLTSKAVKGCRCADGRKQKAYVKKDDAADPIIALQALLRSCLHDTTEGRKVSTCDIPEAFLQTDQPNNDKVIINFSRLMMMEALAQTYLAIYKDRVQFTWQGTKMLYARAKKAIHGTVRAAYLFWLKLTISLKKLGFVENPYNRRTLNRMFGKDQCTIQ